MLGLAEERLGDELVKLKRQGDSRARECAVRPRTQAVKHRQALATERGVDAPGTTTSPRFVPTTGPYRAIGRIVRDSALPSEFVWVGLIGAPTFGVALLAAAVKSYMLCAA